MVYRWWIAAPAALFFIVLEIKEDFMLRVDLINILEMSALSIAMVLIGWLLELLYRSVKAQERALKIIDYKRQISLELMGHADWHLLTEQLVRVPSDIAQVRAVCLYLLNPHTKQYDPIKRWSDGSRHLVGMESDDICDTCLLNKMPGEKHSCGVGMLRQDAVLAELPHCIPLSFAGDVFGMIRFDMQPDKTLTADQTFIFEQISGELAAALKTGLDRKLVAEIQAAEASQAERRKVTRFLHDHLGQNMGFLRLKLDQLIVEGSMVSANMLRKDLAQMLQVANESYDIVRGTIEDIHAQPGLSLTEMLREHAVLVAQQTGLEVRFSVDGQAAPVLADAQRELFYVFREVFSNIVRHAHAKHVDVRLVWQEADLSVLVHDDGIGFNAAEIDTHKHFGLGIMRDRLESIHGRFDFNTVINSGTLVTLRVPINQEDPVFAAV
jgi:signal transduction histidine kinase